MATTFWSNPAATTKRFPVMIQILARVRADYLVQIRAESNRLLRKAAVMGILVNVFAERGGRDPIAGPASRLPLLRAAPPPALRLLALVLLRRLRSQTPQPHNKNLSQCFSFSPLLYCILKFSCS